jgi:hypothetical protein
MGPTTPIVIHHDDVVGIDFLHMIGDSESDHPRAGEAAISVYPNPALDMVTLYVDTIDPEGIQITAVDVLGREIDVVYPYTPLPIGRHRFRWSPVGLPNGMYYLIVRLGSYQRIVPVVVIR